jgi:hypothetical protein
MEELDVLGLSWVVEAQGLRDGADSVLVARSYDGCVDALVDGRVNVFLIRQALFSVRFVLICHAASQVALDSRLAPFQAS